jgi:hypothetical protein
LTQAVSAIPRQDDNLIRPTVASNDQSGVALEFLLLVVKILVVKKEVTREGALTRHPLPNITCPVKAFSMPNTDFHDIIPNYLSMFKSEHFAADRRDLTGFTPIDCHETASSAPPVRGMRCNLNVRLAVLFKSWRLVVSMAMIHAHGTPAREAARWARTERDLSRTAWSIASASATESGSCATPSASAELQACSTIWAIS